jgi:glycosyltransferase involved in cell wall biosynthesis
LDVQVLNKSKPKQLLAKQLQSAFLEMDYLAFSKADAFVAICEADVKFVVQQGIQPSDRCAVVEPGIDEAYLNAPWLRSKKPWLVSLGSWTRRKDPESQVQVVTALFNQIPDLQFHVLGASGEKENIFAAFDETFKSRIVVHPRLTDAGMVEILSQAKVLLFPSLYEGFGMATTEAMACGCAVVVTPTGFGECVGDGVDGFVCNFRDTDAMTARCIQLFADERIRTRLITAARARVHNLSWHEQVKRLEAIYRQFIHVI